MPRTIGVLAIRHRQDATQKLDELERLQFGQEGLAAMFGITPNDLVDCLLATREIHDAEVINRVFRVLRHVERACRAIRCTATKEIDQLAACERDIVNNAMDWLRQPDESIPGMPYREMAGDGKRRRSEGRTLNRFREHRLKTDAAKLYLVLSTTPSDLVSAAAAILTGTNTEDERKTVRDAERTINMARHEAARRHREPHQHADSDPGGVH